MTTQYSEDFLIAWAKKQSVNPDFDAKMGQLVDYLEQYRAGVRLFGEPAEAPPKRRKKVESEAVVGDGAVVAETGKVEGA